MKRVSFRRLCNVKAHRRLKLWGYDSKGLLRLSYCEDCGGLRVDRIHWQAPHVESLVKVAEAVYHLAPKPHEIPNRHLPLPTDIIMWCVRNYHMSKETAELALSVLLDLGENLYVSVDGIPARLHVGTGHGTKRGFEAIIRLIDQIGDPPFVRTVFECPGCGKEYYADDMVINEPYYCDECLTWFSYDGLDVKKTVPYTGYIHVGGFIRDKLTGRPLTNTWLAIRKKNVCSDERGFFIFEYLPWKSVYEINIKLKKEINIPIKIAGEGTYMLELDVVKCYECNHLWVEVGNQYSNYGKYRCPACGTSFLYEYGRLYRLKEDEAFCYDFNCDCAWWWRLKCPHCNAEVSLEFESGRWFCSRCRSYVEPMHHFSSFRCIMPCGHEHAYPIAYLVRNIPIKCWTCSLEYELPANVKNAWKNSSYIVVPGDFIAHAEYFTRRNPWVVPVAITTIIVGSLIIGLSSLALGGKDEK